VSKFLVPAAISGGAESSSSAGKSPLLEVFVLDDGGASGIIGGAGSIMDIVKIGTPREVSNSPDTAN